MSGASRNVVALFLPLFAAAIFTAALVCAKPAAADEASLAGKQINVIIGAAPGGGTDSASRLVARFLQKYLPGNPRMVYRNMPAGNGTQATNYFANDAARDGTAWMAGDNSYISASALRDTVSKFDPRTFNFIGGVLRGGNIMIMAKDKVAALGDKSKPAVVVGTPTNMNTGAELMAWGAEALGWNIRFVIGYPSTPGMVLALRRGEIDVFSTSNLTILQPLEESGNFVPAIQAGQLEGGRIVARQAYPNTPILPDMVAGKMSGLTAEAFDYWLKSDQIDKWFALPPKVSPAMAQSYVAAYEQTFNDPEFVKLGKLQFSSDFALQSAADIAEIVRVRSYPRAETLNEIRRVKEKHGLPGEPLTDAELAALAAKFVKEMDVKSTITQVDREGRSVHFKSGEDMHKVDVSDGRTDVEIAGQKEKRANLKVGMNCRFVYPGNGSEAKTIHCM